MRIAVIGAGAVGGAMAALLDRAGHEVEVTARGAHGAAIAERGIRLTGAWGTHTARVGVGERLGSSADLVIVTTKAQDAAAAITDNLASLGDAPLLIVQNGLDAIDTARAAAPGHRVVGGLALFAASYLSPGDVTVTTANPTWIGGDDSAATAEVAKLIGSAFPVHRASNFAGAQWTKLVINQVNALPAITGRSVQDVIADARLRAVLVASMKENVAVGLALGVHFASLGGLSHPRLVAFNSAPARLAGLLPRRMRRRMGPTPNPGSTLQSIRRGQLTEVDYLNGAVVAAGEGAGVPTPVNGLIVRLVHEVEASKAFIVPEVVVARVAIATGAE